MHMGDGRPGLGGLDRRIGDLLRRHRDGGMLADGIARAGDGAGDDDFLVHVSVSPWAVHGLGRGK